MDRVADVTMVWAIRDPQTRCGVFTNDEQKAVKLKNSHGQCTEIRVFDLKTEWKNMCEYFDGWEAEDYSCANRLRIAFLGQ